MKVRILGFVFVSIVAFFPADTLAWGTLGHRIIGGIAEQYISEKTKSEIRKLLGNESLAMASNWADLIKSDRVYNYLDPWHYINIRSGLSEPELYNYLRSETSPNLYNRLQFIIKELKSNRLTTDRRAFYLKLLIHFIGDAHQPMHAGRPEDRGGNKIKVYWFGEQTNVHRVWDEHLIELQQLSFTEYIAAINFVSPGQKQSWQSVPSRQWVYESYLLAQKIYSSTKAEDKLGYAYNYSFVQILNGQLLKAGVRLAAVLNDIFGG
jgi:hypothetical protein